MKRMGTTRSLMAMLAGVSLLVVAFWATGCGDADHNGHDHGSADEEVAPEVATAYYCPMRCEGDTTYDEPGTCPVCEMNLVAVDAESDGHADHDHDHGAGAHD